MITNPNYLLNKHRIEGMKNIVKAWAKGEAYKYREPTLKNFLYLYSEYDHEELYDLIESEIKRVSTL